MPLPNVRLCGSYTKQDPEHKPCRQPAMRSKKRCKLHRGKATGPKTPEGKLRSAQANFKHGLYSKTNAIDKAIVKEMLTWKNN